MAEEPGTGLGEGPVTGSHRRATTGFGEGLRVGSHRSTVWGNDPGAGSHRRWSQALLLLGEKVLELRVI